MRSATLYPPRPLSALIDDGALSAYQILVIALCGLITLLDGFDTQAIGFVASAIATVLHLPITAFGPIFAAGLLGGLFGALGFGRVSDRFGRKTTLVITIGVFAIGSLLTIEARSVMQLIACRLVTGLGLGGAIPSTIAMTAEYAPRRMRATLVTAMFCGFPLGAVVGAAAIARLLPSSGWQVVFIVGGLLPLPLLPVVIFAMPESVQWLAARGRGAAIGRILAHMNRLEDWDGRTQLAPASADPRTGVARLFGPRLAGGTLLLWAAFFLSLLLVYLLVSWIPTIAQQTGRGLTVGTLAAAALNFGGIAGSVCFGRLIDRLGPFSVIGLAYVGGALMVLALGLGTDLAASIYWFAGLVGFFCVGAQLCVVAIASDHYPLELRATGVGWAMGVGRVGAITGPLVGALLIATPGRTPLFVVLAAISCACGLIVFAMGVTDRRHS
jgi:AAHS family 4-hydroxybenzoate transporter-like MFS transporter